MKLVLTCEHASNFIPEEYRYLFKDAGTVLYFHRGYDPGAFDLFQDLVPLADFSQHQEISRLLVEVNRSIGHPLLFSEFSKGLSKTDKAVVLDHYYFPYRNQVKAAIRKFIEKGEKVLHFSVHSFTPKLNGIIRKTDIGLLYDPSRTEEKAFCKRFKEVLNTHLPGLRIRYNYPYLGKADGLTTSIRKEIPENYAGIELEVNQKYVEKNRLDPELKLAIFRTLQQTLV